MGALRLTALAAALAAGCGSGPPAADLVESGIVDRVVDGDTLRLADGRRVRLVQVDAPEEERECYGPQATRALAELVPPGTAVELERDAALDDADEGGRLLRYVLAGRRNVNVALVARGAAAPYFFRGSRGRHATALLAAAREARAQGRGFWGACPRARLEPALGSLTGRA